MATNALAADRGDRPYICSVVDSIRKKISQPRPQLPLTPSLGDGSDSSVADANRRRKPILPPPSSSSPSSLLSPSPPTCTIPARLAEFATRWCRDYKIEEYQVLTRGEVGKPSSSRRMIEADAEEESKAEAVAIYHVGSQSQGDDGTMSRSFESSIDGYEVNGEISFRVGGDGNEAKAMSEKQELRIVFGSGQAPSVLESILRKATPGWRAEVFVMDDSEVSQMLMFAHPSQARGGASDEQQSSGSLIHYSVRVDEVVQIRDIGNGSRDLIKRRVRIGKGEFPVDCILDDDAEVDIEFKSLTTPEISLKRCTLTTGSSRIPDLVTSAIKLMLPEEHAVVQAQGKYLPSWAATEQEKIHVILHGFKLIADRKWPTKGLQEVVAAVNALRAHANTLLQENRAEEAEERYRRILQQAKAIDTSCDADDVSGDEQNRRQQEGDSAARHQELLLAIAKTQLNHAKALHSMGLARQAMSIADEVAQSRDIGALLQLKALYRKAKCALSLDEDSTFQKSVERIRELGEQQSTSSGGAEGEISEEAETVIVDLQSFQAKMKSRGFYNSH